MRIQNNLNVGLDPLKKETTKTANRPAFSEVIVQTKQKMHQEALQQLIGKIEAKGEILSRRMTVEDLREYKKLVKQFMEEAVGSSLQLKEEQGFTRRGRPKTYKVVQQIDQKLIDLTNEVVQKEKNGLEILAIVGEIKGLLLNLYI